MLAGKMATRNVYTISWFHTPSVHQGNLRYISGEQFTTEQNYSLEVPLSYPQQNGSQISETQKIDYLISFWKYIQINGLVEGKRLLRSCSLYRLQAEQELHKMSNQNVFYNAAKLGNDLQSLCSLINYHQARTAESIKLDFHIYILTCISFLNCQLIPSCNSLPWWHL